LLDSLLQEIQKGMSETDILDGVGNEVVYFFVFLVLLLVTVIAWYSTYVVEPVVQSVILVERSPVSGAGTSHDQDINSSTVEEVRQAVTQFLQQQQQLETADTEIVQAEAPEQQDQNNVAEEVANVSEPVPEEERVTVRLKFLNDTQRDVEASLVENVGQFKRRNFSEEISSNKIVKLIFNGQVLRDDSCSLRSFGIFDKCVVHCLIHQGPASDQPGSGQTGARSQHQSINTNTQHRDLDLSAYFIPILGVALACLWYFAVAYTSYFNFLSTSALIGLTSLYFLTVYGTHFHVNVAVRT